MCIRDRVRSWPAVICQSDGNQTHHGPGKTLDCSCCHGSCGFDDCKQILSVGAVVRSRRGIVFSSVRIMLKGCLCIVPRWYADNWGIDQPKRKPSKESEASTAKQMQPNRAFRARFAHMWLRGSTPSSERLECHDKQPTHANHLSSLWGEKVLA